MYNLMWSVQGNMSDPDPVVLHFTNLTMYNAWSAPFTNRNRNLHADLVLRACSAAQTLVSELLGCDLGKKSDLA